MRIAPSAALLTGSCKCSPATPTPHLVKTMGPHPGSAHLLHANTNGSKALSARSLMLNSNVHLQRVWGTCRIVKTMLAEKCGKQLPKAMGYLGLAWGMVMPLPLKQAPGPANAPPRQSLS